MQQTVGTDSDGDSNAPRPSVLLVHGLLGQRHIYWNLFRRRLRADGFRVHEIIMPYGLIGDIRIAARFLSDKIDATLRGDDVEHVHLVCHSAGGLVARYCAKYLANRGKIRSITTMGTPHNGTYVAYTLPVPLLPIARQTRPGSHFLEEINGPGALAAGVQYVNLWSPFDAVVLPAEHGVLPGSKNIRLEWISHWGFLLSRTVYDHVRDALNEAEGACPLKQPE